MKAKPFTHTLILLMALVAFAFVGSVSFAADDDDDKEDKAAEKEEKADEDADEEPGDDAEGGDSKVFSVEEQAEVSELKGKAVIVKGTVKAFTVSKTSGHGKIAFDEGKVVAFIPKAYMATFEEENWDFDSLKGKEIFVAGEVVIYRDTVQVHISRPDQIAESADELDLSKALLPKKKKTDKPPKKQKQGPAAPGAIYPSKKDLPKMELKLEEATVQTIGFYLKDTGMKVKEDPFGLPLDRLMPKLTPVTATVKKMEGIGPMQVAFPKPNEKSKGAVKDLLDQLAESYGKWPTDALVTIDTEFESRAFKDDPATLVIAALIHSLVTGKEISPSVVISADVADDGSLAPPGGNVDNGASNYDILKAVGADATEPMRFICAGMETDELNDLALDGEWATLSSVSVLVAPTLKDALKVIFAEPEGELGKAFTAFDQAQAVIKKSGVAMVKNKHVQQRVMAAGKIYPANKSAVFYAYYGKGKVPRSYSLPRTHQLLNDLHTDIRFLHALHPDDAKEKFRAFGTTIKSMRSKINPDLATLTRAVEDFEREASSATLRPRSGKQGERQEEDVKESDKKVTAELAALAAKISGVELEEEEEEEEE